MIYLDDKKASAEEFENLLKLTSEEVKKYLDVVEVPASISGTEFEKIVFDASVKCSAGSSFEGKLRQTSDREFPDIVDDEYFGVEVKATKKDDWVSIGNSVLESSRVLNIEKIYVFFGKLGGYPDVRVKTYEDCLKGIAVTHYPRYQIDMNLSSGESIFEKMGTSYQVLRNEKNPVKQIRAYYQSKLKPGEELWWISDDLDSSTAPSPVIKFLSSLSSEARDLIIAEVFVLFPKILSSDSTKFNEVAAYLVSVHGIVASNLRDYFTAGGQVAVKLKGQEIKAPRIVGEAIRLMPQIKNRLSVETSESLATQWKKKVEESNSEDAWLAEVDSQAISLGLAAPISEIIISNS